jgi:hypothetical protein
VIPAAVPATKRLWAPIRLTPPVRRRRRSFDASTPADAPAETMTATPRRTSDAIRLAGNARSPRRMPPPRRTNERRRVREADPRFSRPPTMVAATRAAAAETAERRMANPADSPRTLIA